MTQRPDDISIAEALLKKVSLDRNAAEFDKEITASDISLAWIAACLEALEAGKIDDKTRNYIENRAANLAAAISHTRSKYHYGQSKH